MRIFITLEKELVTGWGTSKGNTQDIEIGVPDNHEVLKNPFIFRYQNGQLIKDVEYQQQLIKEKEEQKNKPSLEEQISELQRKNLDMTFQLMMKGLI